MAKRVHSRNQAGGGQRRWFNKTPRPLKFRFHMHEGNADTWKVPPWGAVDLPDKDTRAIRKTWGKTLTDSEDEQQEAREAHEREQEAIRNRAGRRRLPPADPADEEPLGDGDKPIRGEDKGDAGRTAGDALEAAAVALTEQHSHDELEKMAKGHGVSAGGSSAAIARRIARKLAE